MSLGGLIPIGGGGGGGGGAKKANDLTSGLISISAPKGGGGGGDLDMSDFDVDDLLSDTGGTKSKSKAAASPTSKESKAKKKSGSSSSKSKDKSASSSKKKSSKKKKTAALDDSADNDDLDGDSNDWGGGGGGGKTKSATTSKWSLDDDSSEFDATPPVRKKGGLDAEFAKMLGLDDFGADTAMATAPHADNDDDGNGVSSFGARSGEAKSELFGSSNKEEENASGVSSFSYEPRVRGGGKGKDRAGVSSIFDDSGSSAKSYSDPFAARTDAASKSSGGGRGEDRDAAVEAPEEAPGGLSASFFQNESSKGRRGEGADADDPFGGSSLSFLSSASERRGGRGGGRRGGGGSSAPVIEDPFASAGSRRSTSAADPFGASPDAEAKAPVLDSLFGSTREKRKESDGGDSSSGSKQHGVEASTSDRAEAAATGSASVGGRRQPQLRANDNDLFAELFPSERAPTTLKSTTTSPLEAPPARDLMAELFPAEPAPSRANESARSDLKPSKMSPTIDKSSRSAKDDLLADLLPTKPARSTPALDKDARSAKDDLLAELSPPKPPKPPPPTLDRSAKDDLLAELLPSKPPKAASPVRTFEAKSAKDDLLAELSPPRTPKAPAELSPGTAKTLASPSKGSIKEADFEQSKDSLLEELLSPAKSPPPSPSRRESSPRRNSYSQSFEDEPPTAESPRRHLRSSSAVASPSPSPVKVRVDALAGPREDSPPSAPSPAKSTTPPRSTPAAASAREVSTELLEEALGKREAELRGESDAARAALLEAHRVDVAALNAAILELQQQLRDAQSTRETLVGEHAQSHARASLLEQEKALLLQQLAGLQTEKLQLQQELHAVRATHAACEAQSALFEAERAGLLDQVRSLEEQSRQLAQRVGLEKQEHQATQLQLASFRQEAEQAASLHKQQEAHHMRQLAQQLRTSLASLTTLQEQVAGDELAKHEVESESRLRMIATLETSSRRCAQQTEDECARLASLLGSLEATLRHARQEHLEEKERLRQEQLRLDVLAAHFQAQSRVLHESADVHTQHLAQHLTASLQDVRVAEARLAARRQAVEDAERELYDERARFAAHREELLQQQAREAAQLQAERLQLDARWQQLQRERADLDAVIASHEDEFQRLEAQRRALGGEREGVEFHARQVADMARSFEAFTQQVVTREGALAAEKQALDRRALELDAQQQSVAGERHALDERELRLRSQLKQMEKARQRLTSQRKEHLAASRAGAPTMTPTASGHPLAAHDLDRAKQRLLERTRGMGTRGVIPRDDASSPPVDNNWRWRTPGADPSGLSPAFRQLVEDNWAAREWHSGAADAALHKERMWISCIGLDTSAPPTTTTTATADASRAAGRHLQHQQRVDAAAAGATLQFSPTRQQRRTPPSPPPPPSSSLLSRRAVTIDL